MRTDAGSNRKDRSPHWSADWKSPG
jgi:hypothetical protein